MTPFDAREFRKALGSFVTGVTVVTTVESEGGPRGFTATTRWRSSVPVTSCTSLDKGRSLQTARRAPGPPRQSTSPWHSVTAPKVFISRR